MAFPQSVIDAALKRAGNYCECQRLLHTHTGRCQNTRNLEAHHITAEAIGGADILSNCEILCATCHKGTQSYGR